ncbi:hypothetical protein [Bosea thiooxidans]
MKISGFDKLQKKMDQLARFGAELDGELTIVKFDPTDPSSIEAAIQEACNAIDAKAKYYADNDMIQNIADQAKETFREQILEKAAAARLKDGNE